MNFSAGMSVPKMQLKFTVAHSTMMEGSEFVVSLRNENETLSCNGNFYDGDVQRLYLEMGEKTKFTFRSEKYVYLPSIRKCRQNPYNYLVADNLLRNVQKNCSKPCKPDSDLRVCYALGLSKGIDELPLCMNKNDTQCFYDSFEFALESLDVYSGPCTKLHHLPLSKFNTPIEKDRAEIHVNFDPPRTTVQEEYLIYDMVAMISAIGGTMGLCIGFSFTHFTSTSLNFVEQIVWKLKNYRNLKPPRKIQDNLESDIDQDTLKLKWKKQEEINIKMKNEIANLTENYAKLQNQITSQGKVKAKENNITVSDLK